MKVAIIGGKLQGTEAAYLAKMAGIESILVDNNPQVPASGICDRFVCGDILSEDPAVIQAMKEADFVLPANENDQVLEAIIKVCKEENLKLAFDPKAYSLSSSKLASDKLFHIYGIPSPRYYPQGKAPYIMKPSRESGSAGVTYAETEEAVGKFLETVDDPENWIVQEYLQGESYSIEVIGNGREYRTYTITQIHMDSVYDCCKVTAPCGITAEQKQTFAQLGEKLASIIGLIGIMDVEVILDGEELKVLEIDARIPSQTPMAVYYSSGMNLLSELADITVYGAFRTEQIDMHKYVAYEHYKREDGEVIQEGEHMMALARPLTIQNHLFSSDIVISDYREGQEDFHGIFVNKADTFHELEGKRKGVKAHLKLLP